MANFTPPVAEMEDIIVSPLQSTNAYSSTIFGNPVVIEGTRKINHTCLKLNGTSDYIVITDPMLIGSIFTIDLWVWFSSISNSEQVIISQVDGSSSGNTSLSIKNQKLVIINNSVETAGATTVIPKVWHHIALVRNGTVCKAYLNGVLEATYSSFVAPNRSATHIGSRLGSNLLSGMLDAIRIREEESWSSDFTVPTRSEYIADEYYDNVSLLLRGDSFTSIRDAHADKVGFQLGMDAYNDSTSMGPWDDTDCHGITFIGNAKIVSGHFKHNHPSISFDGVNDTIVVTNTPNITFGTTFTFEFWVHLPNYTAKMTLFDKREANTLTGLLIYTDTDTKLYAKFGDSTAGWDVELTSGTMSVGWHHIVIVRNASDTNSWKLFVDGTQAGSTVNSAITIAENANLLIGRNLSNAEYFYGQLSEIQLTQDTAKYTTSVTVPTSLVPEPINLEYEQTSLLLHFDGANNSLQFTDSSRWNHAIAGSFGAKISTDQYKFGNSSLYLDGTSYCGLIVDPHESHNLGEGDFTIEAWVRTTALGTARYFLGNWVVSNLIPGPWFLLGMSVANRFVFYLGAAYDLFPLLTGSVVTIVANTWYHVSVTRKNDLWTLWVNGAIDVQLKLNPRNFRTGIAFRPERWQTYGVCLGSIYDFTALTYSSTSVSGWVGYIDEVRIVKGKAMYTQPFTAPTAAYSLSTNYPYRDSNVKMFIDIDQDYLIKDKSISCNELTFEGSIIAGKTIGGSYATFDGTGDAIRCLTGAPGDALFGFDDFTVEAWVYPINGGRVSQNYGRIIETEVNGTAGGFCMSMNNSGTSSPCSVIFSESISSAGVGSDINITTASTIPNSAWSHVAFTKENGLLTSYINGIPKAKIQIPASWTLSKLGVGFTLSNNNKTATCSQSNSWQMTASSVMFDSQSSIGTYFEIVTTTSGSANLIVGVVKTTVTTFSGYPGQTSEGWGYGGVAGNKFTSGTGIAYGATFGVNDVIGVAVKNGKIWFSKNGVWQASGNPVTEANPAYSTLTGTVLAAMGRYTAGSVHTLRVDNTEFSYPMPTDFLSLKDAGINVSYFSKNKISIGANNSAAESFYGNIDDVRITRGIARYGISWAESVLSGDVYSDNVMLLLNCNGTDGGTTFTDSSNSNKTVSVNATVTTVTGTKRFGSASAQFDGTTGYLILNDSDDWNYGSGDFTIEMWYKFKTTPNTAYSSSGGQCIYSQTLDANNYIIIGFGSTNIFFESKSGGATVISLSGNQVHNISWHHLAITRVSNTVSIYQDGVFLASTTLSGSMPNINDSLVIGRYTLGDKYFKGWIDDFRITKGTGRYPAGFGYALPPTGLLPIGRRKIQDLPSGITTPLSIKTLRGANAKFDIAVDLSFNFSPTLEPDSQWFIKKYNYSVVPGVTDFTFEGWFNPAMSNIGWFMSKDINSAGGYLIGVAKNSITFRCPYASDLTVSSLSLTGWNHIVWQRRGNLKQIFLNGIKQSEVTQVFDANEINTEITIGVNGFTASTTRYLGYLDGFRFTRGLARYLTNFTPPTTQFPTKFNSFANSKLMAFFTQPSSLPSNVKIIGTTNIVRPSGVLETGACRFDGDDDYIELASSSSINDEDITLEFWFELHAYGSVSNPIYIWCQGNTLAQTNKVAIASVGPEIKWVYGTTFTSIDVVPLYTWSHFAMTRQNGLLKIYINGIKKYETTLAVFGPGKSVLGLVTDSTISANEYKFKGFITNFRILKNAILYTENFTPSASIIPYDQDNSLPFVDPGNDLVLGDFSGFLDEMTIMNGIPASSMIKYLNEDATTVSPPVPRVEMISNQNFKSIHTLSKQWYGLGKIWGTVLNASGQPMSRKIVLIEYWSYMPVAEVISDPATGYYEFTDLDTMALFSVVAEDFKDYQYNDIIRAKVRAEVV